ncbi:hypothetical protein [Ralstonia pseudosolanacearum]|uniref:hypothetical protein n=2 Tax=Ralstonia pseudosolanacearum TaxID=1310165 RepID=UPI001FF93C97|nr:hypothetical protein [Ralstonia pseudosolanacearum]
MICDKKRNHKGLLISAFTLTILLHLLHIFFLTATPWFNFSDGIYANKGALFDNLGETVFATIGLSFALSFAYLIFCIARKRAIGINFGIALIVAHFVFGAISGSFEQNLISNSYTYNYKSNKSKYINYLSTSQNIYGGISSYTAVDRAVGNNANKSKKLYVWDLGYRKSGIWLLVYDESDDLNNPQTERRNIGRFCVGTTVSGVFECESPSPGRIIAFGGAALLVHKVDGHFYLVKIDNPNSHF